VGLEVELPAECVITDDLAMVTIYMSSDERTIADAVLRCRTATNFR
jgi:hypothetical protein